VRQYKILRLAGVHYPDILSLLTTTYPDFLDKSYNEQQACLFERGALYSNSFSRSMERLGHEAYELIWDFEVIQRQWAKENNFAVHSDTWMLEILMAQIEKIRPDVVYFQGTELCIPGRFPSVGANTNIATIIKDKFPFIRIIAMFSGFPSRTSRLTNADVLFSCTPAIVNHYRRAGAHSILCYHAFDQDVLENLINYNTKPYDFVFLGSTQAPAKRYWMLRELLERTPIQLWVNDIDELEANGFFRQEWGRLKTNFRQSAGTGLRNWLGKLDIKGLQKISQLTAGQSRVRKMVDEVLERKKDPDITDFRVERPTFRRLPRRTLRQMYPNRCKAPVVGIDYYNVLSESRIIFNKHTDHNMGCVGNLRLFEVTGIGGCLLTDTGENINDLFEPEKEIVTYRSVDEAVEKVTYLLDHEDEREEIARAGQKRTLKDHTIFNRCQLIDNVIQSKL
jgi:hypothetical protein